MLTKRKIPRYLFIFSLFACLIYLFIKERKKKEHYIALSEKHLQMFDLTNKWLNLRQDEKNIGEYLFDKGYKRVAVYGMSYIGTSLCRELYKSPVEIICGIDKVKADCIFDIPVVKPNTDLKKYNFDVVIVSSPFYYFEIADELEKYVECPIVSIEEIIEFIGL